MFGANEWLVDELYEQYLQDKNAVDPAWWDFFEDYRPAERSDADTTSDAPAAPSNGSVPAAAPANGSRPAAANGSPAPAAPTAPAPAAPTAVTDGS
ncbi:MAG: 2-oxoglutarate dehydrogenase E1 subunit family protein, partial [Cellulosimicrobium funkei]|uniref:2-oxoglutarate dehydrogenase E1 subunit family protein n=2 Tax=Cellulosimicrobium TaxID=157920 RepID=UPI003F920AC4